MSKSPRHIRHHLPRSWPSTSAAAPAQPLWPADIDRRALSKAVRISHLIGWLHRRRITYQALSAAFGHQPDWFSAKYNAGKLQGQQNWSDADLDALEALVEDPRQSWTRDHRGLHNRTRTRTRRGRFGPGDPADS